MKQSLGKRKYVNWLNFVSFLKNESARIKNKIINNSNQNILYKAKALKFRFKNIYKTIIIKKEKI